MRSHAAGCAATSSRETAHLPGALVFLASMSDFMRTKSSSARALKRRNVARLLVPLELVLHRLHASDVGERSDEERLFAGQDRAAQRHPAALGADVDRMRVRDHAAESGAHPLHQ